MCRCTANVIKSLISLPGAVFVIRASVCPPSASRETFNKSEGSVLLGENRMFSLGKLNSIVMILYMSSSHVGETSDFSRPMPEIASKSKLIFMVILSLTSGLPRVNPRAGRKKAPSVNLKKAIGYSSSPLPFFTHLVFHAQFAPAFFCPCDAPAFHSKQRLSVPLPALTLPQSCFVPPADLCFHE